MSTLALANVTVLALALSEACGTEPVATKADVSVSDAGAHVLWKFGGGNQDVLSVAESRAGTLYAAVVQSNNGSSNASFVVAIGPDGGELWRAAIPEPGAPIALVANAAGDVWAQGSSLTHLAASGSILWSKNLPTLEEDATALASDGTFFHFVDAPQWRVALEAIGPDGASRWSIPLGGNTNGSDLAHRTVFEAPAIDVAGRVNVSCQPCADGRTGIAQVDAGTGSVLNVVVALASDAGLLDISDGVTCDAEGNLYFATQLAGAFPILASTGPSGAVRWTSPNAWLPALVGPKSIVLSGFVAVSPTDGTLVESAATPDSGTLGYGALAGLVAGGLRMMAVTFGPAGSFGVGGTLISDSRANPVWSEPALVAATAIAAVGRVYGIERDGAGHGTLVAVAAPITGLEESAWPMVKHDPGRTSSAAGSW